jgi:phosphotriesterase-related protein
MAALPLALPPRGDDVFPYVLERGISKEQIDTMLVGVPRAFFEGR